MGKPRGLHRMPLVIRKVDANPPLFFIKGKGGQADRWTTDLQQASVNTGRLGLWASRKIAKAVGGEVVSAFSDMTGPN